MALQCVRETSGNRCVAAFAEAAEADEIVAALGSGYGRVAVSDAQQGSLNANSIIGMVVANSGAVSAYAAGAAAVREARRGQCYDLIAEALSAAPALSVEADTDAIGIMHKYLRMCYAAAARDANMNNPMRFGEVEAACKGGDPGIAGFWKLLATSATVRQTWTTGLGNTLRVLRYPDTSGGLADKSATLPADWHSNADYHPIRAWSR